MEWPPKCTETTMRYFRGIKPLLGLVLACATTVLSRGAVVASAPASQHNAPTPGEVVLSLSATDYAWHPEGGAVAAATRTEDAKAVPGAKYLPASISGTEQAPEESDIVRHRGFRKVLLVLLLCGGLIRFVT